MDGDGDDQEMEDNGESLLFLPGDDFVEFVYKKYIQPIFHNSQTNHTNTGYHLQVEMLVVYHSFGLLLMGLGAFILRRAYRLIWRTFLYIY